MKFPEYDRLMEKARATNAERSKMDRQCTGGAPEDDSTEELARTAAMAIKCGMKMKDWDNVAEGLAMLDDVLYRMVMS